MIIVCSNFDKRLDKIWYHLQHLAVLRVEGISQYDCDELCVEFLECVVKEAQTFDKKVIQVKNIGV